MRKVLLKHFKIYLRLVIETEREISKRRRSRMAKNFLSFQIAVMEATEKIMDLLRMLILLLPINISKIKMSREGIITIEEDIIIQSLIKSTN